MWTREKSGGGRGVWGCVPNLFFFFPRNPPDVDGDPVDVSAATSTGKCAENFFSRARESSFVRKSNHQVYFLFVLVVLFVFLVCFFSVRLAMVL